MMRYVPNDKYTIAWFKLAECVAKGEKEKACGVYRLLMHSLEDQAYAYQLEGDLLSAFCDERALEKYTHAAQLYYSDNRFKEAAALYEELVFKITHDDKPLLRLIEIYKKHKNKDIFKAKLIKISDLLIEKKMAYRARFTVEQLCTLEDRENSARLYTAMIISLITYHADMHEAIADVIHQALMYLSQQENQKELQLLLTTLEQVNTSWYEYSSSYLKGGVLRT